MVEVTEVVKIEITYEDGEESEAEKKKEEYEESGFTFESKETFDGGTGLIVLTKIY